MSLRNRYGSDGIFMPHIYNIIRESVRVDFVLSRSWEMIEEILFGSDKPYEFSPDSKNKCPQYCNFGRPDFIVLRRSKFMSEGLTPTDAHNGGQILLSYSDSPYQLFFKLEYHITNLHKKYGSLAEFRNDILPLAGDKFEITANTSIKRNNGIISSTDYDILKSKFGIKKGVLDKLSETNYASEYSSIKSLSNVVLTLSGVKIDKRSNTGTISINSSIPYMFDKFSEFINTERERFDHYLNSFYTKYHINELRFKKEMSAVDSYIDSVSQSTSASSSSSSSSNNNNDDSYSKINRAKYYGDKSSDLVKVLKPQNTNNNDYKNAIKKQENYKDYAVLFDIHDRLTDEERKLYMDYKKIIIIKLKDNTHISLLIRSNY